MLIASVLCLSGNPANVDGSSYLSFFCFYWL